MHFKESGVFQNDREFIIHGFWASLLYSFKHVRIISAQDLFSFFSGHLHAENVIVHGIVF